MSYRRCFEEGKVGSGVGKRRSEMERETDFRKKASPMRPIGVLPSVSNMSELTMGVKQDPFPTLK
jgi:hypothetical protein